MSTPIPPQLGKQVTFRTFSWLANVEQAWGGQYRKPDPGIYKWSDGRSFESTDQFNTGIYNGGIRP